MHSSKTLVVCCAATLFAGQPANAGFLFFPSDITTGGTATAFPANTPANETPDKMFDNLASTKGLIFNGADVTPTAPVIWIYDFADAAAFQVVQYSLTSANDSPARDPRNFFLQGSNDGSSWITVDTVVNHTFVDQPTFGDNSTQPADATRFETFFFDVDTPGTYQQYRLRIEETFDPVNDRPQVAEMQLFTTQVIPEPAVGGLLGLGALLGLRRRRK